QAGEMHFLLRRQQGRKTDFVERHMSWVELAGKFEGVLALVVERCCDPGIARAPETVIHLESDLVHELFIAAVPIRCIIIIYHVHAPPSVETLDKLPIQFPQRRTSPSPGLRENPLMQVGPGQSPLTKSGPSCGNGLCPGASCSVHQNYDSADTGLFCTTSQFW